MKKCNFRTDSKAVHCKPRTHGFAAVAVFQILLLWYWPAQADVSDGAGDESQEAPVEEQLAAQSDAIQPASPPAPKPGSSTEARPDGKKGPKVSGYFQFHFNQPIGGAENRFRIQRARVSLEGKVNNYIIYEVDFDPRSPEHSGLLRDAFFDVKYRPNHTLRLGQHKTKFGYINQRSSSRLYTVNRPELADELSRGITLRDIGATLLGKHPLGEGLDFEYAVSIVNGAGMNVQRDNNKDKNFSGRIGLRSKGENAKWRLGLSASHGDLFEPDTDSAFVDKGGYFINFKRLGTDFFIDHDWFDLNGEFAIGRHEELGVEDTIHGSYLTLVGKPSGPIGPVLSYDSINWSENVRVMAGAYHGKPDDPFRVLLNYEVRGSLSTGRFYLWSLVRL